jgi:Spy/CpxP family protein refolding chaperone
MRFLTAIGTVMALATAAPLSAQQTPPTQPPRRPMRMGQQMQPRMQGPMRQGMGMRMGMRDHAGLGIYAPQVLLNRRTQLNLTDDQAKQLEALSTELQQARAKADTALEAHHEKMLELWKADRPDVNAIQSEARAGMQLRGNMEIAQLGAAAKAKGLLTAEQRGFIQGWQDAHRGRGMGRGMQGGPRMGRRMMQGRGMMRGPGGPGR